MSSTSAVDIRTHAVSALSMVTSFSPGSGLRVGSARASPETHCRTAMEVPAPPLQCKPDLGRGRPDPQRCSGSAHWRQFRLIRAEKGLFDGRCTDPIDLARNDQIVWIGRNDNKPVS